MHSCTIYYKYKYKWSPWKSALAELSWEPVLLLLFAAACVERELDWKFSYFQSKVFSWFTSNNFHPRQTTEIQSENDCNRKSNVHVSTALFCVNVIFIFVFALISISIFVFVCVLYLYLRSESHLCQWCQLRQLEYHNSPRGLVWGDWYDFGGSNIWKKFDDWMILENNLWRKKLVI